MEHQRVGRGLTLLTALRHPSAQDRLFMGALLCWLLMLILTPIADWTGLNLFRTLATAGVITHAGVTAAALMYGWRGGRIFLLLMTIGVFTWVVEFIGVKSGLLFGAYHYTDALQPQIGGVPLIIPLAWFMMLPPSWAVVMRFFTPTRPWHWLPFAALSGLAFTAWDLYLDPQMVARDLWVWEQPGAYFGIPLHNFLGWFLTSSLLTLLIRPSGLPLRPLALIYALVWWFQAVGLGIFWGQIGPALVGCMAMGVFVVLAWRGGRQ